MGGVLVVEDDREVRDALVDLLTHEGYPVQSAADGQQALEAMVSMLPLRPGLVLLDMMMPRMSGNEFLLAVERLPVFASVPVVAISAYPNLPRPTARRFLKKPLDFDRLLKIIDELCPRPWLDL